MKTRSVLNYLFLILFLSSPALAAPASVDTQKSTLTVRVYKSGFFSAFAHDHEISAPMDNGLFVEENPSIQISINAAKLKVMDKERYDTKKQKSKVRIFDAELL